MLLCCRNSSNTAQNILRNGKCTLNFIDDKPATFKEAVKACFKKYASGRGRANRVEYWMWWLFVLIATAFIVVGWLMLPVLIIPTISATVRRLHDVDKSGWWILLGIIPLANLYLIYLLARKGNKEDNRYGIAAEA
jgi:uncharacterized membrane protein YhaH (DUF805 family)